MIALKFNIDPDKTFDRALTELERSQIPFATSKTINRLVLQMQTAWKGDIRSSFKNPRQFTLNAPMVRTGNKNRPEATVFMRDKAAGGISPNTYLQAQVFGGEARLKRAEKHPSIAEHLTAGMRVAPGKGARLDASGDISGRQFKGILEGLKTKQGAYFAIGERSKSHLKPGILARKGRGDKRTVRAVLNFISAPKFKKRLEIFDIAEKVQKRNAATFFKEELQKAVKSTFNKTFGL